jgi:Uma2 family endonuclease
VQLPIEVTSISEPEPDFSLITPEDLARARRHPTCAPLVVEVANTSLDYDRTEKASLYARAGVPEYWILNVRDRQLEVHLDPAPNPKGFFGYAYASVTILGPDELVTASFLPPIPIRVLDLLGT